MSSPEISQNLIARTVEIFESADDVYSIPVDIPNPFPRSYSAFDLGAAAIDAMGEAGLLSEIGRKPQEILSIRNQLREGAKELVPDWQKISRRRELAAIALNSFFIDGFNPN